MDLQIGCFLKAAKLLQQVKSEWPQGPEDEDEEVNMDADSLLDKNKSSNCVSYARASYSSTAPSNKKRTSADSAFEQSTIATNTTDQIDGNNLRRPSTISINNNNNNNESQYLHPGDRRSFCSTSTGASSATSTSYQSSTGAATIPSINNDNNASANPFRRSLSQRSSKSDIISPEKRESFINNLSRKQCKLFSSCH